MNHRQIVYLLITALSALSFAGQPPLREYADSLGLNIGTAVGVAFYQGEEDYIQTIVREFNTVVHENELKPDIVHPQRGVFSFTQADRLVAFAINNSMNIRGHTLIWHDQNPDWIQKNEWSREEGLDAMREHIQRVVGHYRGKIFEWDVVNEAFTDGGNSTLRPNSDNPWRRAIGDDYIDSAFAIAHRADPDAILYYNDYSISKTNLKSTAIYNMVSQMVQNGIPIHGVGFQAHRMETEWNSNLKNEIAQNLERFSGLGLRVAYTELDVRINLPASNQNLINQANVYKAFLEAALENGSSGTFMVWGFTDKHSWIPGHFTGYGDALIFDETYEKKPAYDSLSGVLDKWTPGFSGNDGHMLTIVSEGLGTVSRNPVATRYSQGSEVTLTAVANDGWTFYGWSGEGINGSIPTLNLTINSDTFLSALFARSTSAGDRGNFIWNGDFSNGTQHWQLSYWNSKASYSLSDNECIITITDPGTLDYNIQLIQSGILLEQEKTYRVTFDAYASIQRPMRVNVALPVDPWTSFLSDVEGETGVTLTTERQTFSFEFTMNNPANIDSRIEFNVGANQGDVTVTNVSLTEVPDLPIRTPSRPLRESDFKIGTVGSGISVSFKSLHLTEPVIKIYNLKGDVVIEMVKKNSCKGNVFTLDVADISNGYYVVRLYEGRGVAGQSKVVLSR